MIKSSSNKVTSYLRAITAHYETITRTPEYFRQFVMCDMVCTAAFLDSTLVTVRFFPSVHTWARQLANRADVAAGLEASPLPLRDWRRSFSRRDRLRLVRTLWEEAQRHCGDQDGPARCVLL